MNTFRRTLAAALAALALSAVAAPATAQAPGASAVRESADFNAEWVSEELADADVVLPSNVYVVVTEAGNCGSQLSPLGVGGGCTTHLSDGSIFVAVSAAAIDNGTGEHILFHELGHALYNMGECEAEYFAHEYSAPNLWSYPACKK